MLLNSTRISPRLLPHYVSTSTRTDVLHELLCYKQPNPTRIHALLPIVERQDVPHELLQRMLASSTGTRYCASTLVYLNVLPEQRRRMSAHPIYNYWPLPISTHRSALPMLHIRIHPHSMDTLHYVSTPTHQDVLQQPQDNMLPCPTRSHRALPSSALADPRSRLHRCTSSSVISSDTHFNSVSYDTETIRPEILKHGEAQCSARNTDNIVVHGRQDEVVPLGENSSGVDGLATRCGGGGSGRCREVHAHVH